MSKKCFFCGAILEDEDIFCDECGKKQDQASVIKQVEHKSEPKMHMEVEQKAKEETKQIVQERVSAKAESKQLEQKKCKEEIKYNPIHFAWAGLVFGIISWITLLTATLFAMPTSIIGIALGIKGLKSKKRGLSIVSLFLNGSIWAFVVYALVS